MASYEYFYPGTPSSMESEYSSIFSGYQFPAGRLSLTTNINTGNQLQEVSNLLNQGVKNVEVSLVNKQVFDQIPKQHMKEIARLTELTGSKVSLHAPFADMTDLSGFDSRTREWNEEQRKSVEREMTEIVQRGNEIDKNGNVNITIHPSNQLPASSYHKEGDKIITDVMHVYNIIDEKLAIVKAEEEYKPEKGADVVRISPQERMDEVNKTFWKNSLRELGIQAGRANEYLLEGRPATAAGELLDSESKISKLGFNNQKQGELHLEGVDNSLRDLYARAMKSANETNNERAKEILREAHNEYSKKVAEMQKEHDDYRKNVLLRGEAVNVMLRKMGELTEDEEVIPKIYVSADEFAIKQTSKTLSNVALSAYEKFGDKAPTLSIENPPYGLSMSSGEELAKLIKNSRNRLAEELAEKEGMSYDRAQEVAEKMIGVTWDTAHISGMKAHGFSKKDIIEQSKKVAPFVKHVHMNDSLGGQMMGDLPPGMGDVPIKDIMGEFADKGFKGTAVFESGAFAAMHRITPHPFVLEAMGSPLYPMKVSPTWNRSMGAGMEAVYYSGMGPFLPDYSFQMYGAGFTNLPTELGGQTAGAGRGRDRFSGTPMD